MIRFISNKRGKSLLYQGFLFKKNKSKPEIIYFKCSNFNCPTRLALDGSCSFVINPPKPEHSHEPPYQKIQAAEFRDKVLRSVENNPTRKLKDIYDEELQGSTSDFVPLYTSIRPTLSKKRAKTLPPVPKMIHDVDIKDDWAKTVASSYFDLRV